ncbi:hypothetical protein H8942_18515, partial [Bacillus pumilus]
PPPPPPPPPPFYPPPPPPPPPQGHLRRQRQMCIRDRGAGVTKEVVSALHADQQVILSLIHISRAHAVSYTHLRAHETDKDIAYAVF